MKTRILWSGITGRTGQKALEQEKFVKESNIVAGVCRTGGNWYTYNQLDDIKEDFDVIVDFSHKDCFDKILQFAKSKKKPLISGTSGLEQYQLDELEKVSFEIPIFRGGNFRFDVENFINDCVEWAKTHDDLIIIETHYKTKKIPSETAKVIVKRIFDATGKTVKIESHLEYDELINDYVLGNLHCRVQGFEDLAKNVLEIANMMKNKKPNGLYSLKRLFDEQKSRSIGGEYV